MITTTDSLTDSTEHAMASAVWSVRLVLGITALLFSTILRADIGLDVIVLVDRSESMASARHLSALFVPMVLDLVARNATANRVDHRIAVIGFGSAARLEVPFVWCNDRELARFRRQFEQPSADLGHTNFAAAFTAASRLFDTLPADPERRRSILLFTDGKPYAPSLNANAGRASLHELIATDLGARRIPLTVLLLDGDVNAMWRKLAGRVHVTGREPDQMLARSHAAITELVGTRRVEAVSGAGSEGTDHLTVPPYLEMIVFDVFRGSPDAAVELIPPAVAAAPIGSGSNDGEAIRTGDVMATYVVPRPRPGEWTIRKSHKDARVRIVSQQFFPRGVLIQPAGETVRQHDRVQLTYRVLDGARQPLQEVPGYPLSLELAIADPSGVRRRLPMASAADQGLGVFRSIEGLECTLSGRYWTDVKVTTLDSSGRRLDIFHDRWSGFSVSPAQQVDCHVQTSGAVAWLPLDAEVACYDSDARAIDMRAMATGSSTDLFRAMLWRNGRVSEAALDLESSERGTLRGRLRGASRSGSYRLQIIADRTRLRPAYNIRFIPAEITFTRHGSLEWLAGSSGLVLLVVIGRMLVRRSVNR